MRQCVHRASAAVVDHRIITCIANVLHDNGVAGSTGSTENTAYHEDTIILLKHVGELSELLAILELIKRNTPDVRTSHESDVHFGIELIVGEQHREQRLITCIEGVIGYKVLEFLRFDGSHIEKERIG